MVFAEDCSNGETLAHQEKEIEILQQALDPSGLHISREKTVYDVSVGWGGEAVKKTEKFKYLGSIFQSNGDINEDVTYRIWGKLNKLEAGQAGSSVIDECPSS